MSHKANLWVRRNPVLAAGLAVSTVLVAGSGFVALKAWADRRAAVALAQRWSAEVAHLEAARRQIHMLPTRDVRPELAQLEARHRQLEAEVDRAPDTARGSGQFALARAAMAFHRWEKARDHLEASRLADYGGADADLARGEVTAQLFLAALREIERLPGPELRARRMGELERDLREPALRDLRKALQGGAASSLSGALLALLEKAPDLALARAREAFQAEPWRYEAKLLEAEIRINQARVLRLTGGYQPGLEELDRADPAVQTACEIGRSDPAAWMAQAARWEVTVVIARHLGSRRFDALEKALQACLIAEACRPGHAPALALRGRLTFLRTDMQAEKVDPTEGFQRAAELLQAAILADPANTVTHGDLAELEVSRGLRRMQLGQDPLAAFRSAIAAGRQGLALHPSEPRLLNIVGLAWLHSATWTLDNGQDPGPSLDQAEANFKAIEAIDARVPFAQNNLGWTNLIRARRALEVDEDPLSSAAAAERHLLRCIELNPNSAHSRQLLGDVAVTRGRYWLDRARDPAPELNRAREAMKRAQEINPIYPATFLTRCRLEVLREEALARFGGSLAARREALVDLEAAYGRLAEIAPGRLDVEIERARVLIARAGKGKSTPLRAEARRCLNQVLARQPRNPEALALLRRLG